MKVSHMCLGFVCANGECSNGGLIYYSSLQFSGLPRFHLLLHHLHHQLRRKVSHTLIVSICTSFFGMKLLLRLLPASITTLSIVCFMLHAECKVISGAKPLITALKDLSRWKELGLALGVPSEELEAFEKYNEEAELKKRASAIFCVCFVLI